MDATRLGDGLREYIDALQRQLSAMRDQGHRVNASWQITREVYRGSGAELFADEFERVSRTLEKYVEMLEQVLPILRERLEALEGFDSSSSPPN